MNRESASSIRRRRVASSTAAFAVAMLLLMIVGHHCTGFGLVRSPNTAQNRILSLPLTHRKLLTHGEEEKGVEPNRIWGEKCSKSDIVISQGATDLLNGIPTYTVEIMNTCPSGCNISSIHLSCGWFSSFQKVNPRVFKRIRFDNCLVNDGKPLVNGRMVTFKYASTFRFPLKVSSVRC